MKKTVKIVIACGLIALSWTAWCLYFVPAENAVELRLSLAKNEWEAGEFLWYKLEIKNIGHRRIEFFDRAWFNSGALAANSDLWHGDFNPSLTRLLVFDPDGKPVYPMTAPFGYHGERKMWTDDCGAKDCHDIGIVSLAAGETLTAAPSKEAPIRYKRNGLGDPGDIRIPPSYDSEKPSGADSPQQREWKKLAESVWRDGTARLGPRPESNRTIPLPGYTVLDRYDFHKPGRHEMKVILVACGGDLKNETEARTLKKENLSEDCRAWIKASRNLYFASNTVVFTIVPAKQSFLSPRKPASEAARQTVKKREAALERAIKAGDSRTPDIAPAVSVENPAA